MQAKELFDFIVKIFEIVIVPLVFSIYKDGRKQTEDIGTLKTILIGADGKNGIRSRVRRLERTAEKTNIQLALLTGQINHHEEEEDGDDS